MILQKLASLLELAADALSALRPKEESDNVHSNDGESAVQAKEASKEVKAVSPSQAFEKAASEYYKAVDVRHGCLLSNNTSS